MQLGARGLVFSTASHLPAGSHVLLIRDGTNWRREFIILKKKTSRYLGYHTQRSSEPRPLGPAWSVGGKYLNTPAVNVTKCQSPINRPSLRKQRNNQEREVVSAAKLIQSCRDGSSVQTGPFQHLRGLCGKIVHL